MAEYEEFTADEIINALKFDIKHYKRKHDYHIGLSEVYIERIKEVQKQIDQVRKKSAKRVSVHDE